MQDQTLNEYENMNTDFNVSDKIVEYAIEEILSSKGRVVILKTLAEMEELNISAIARIANLNHSTATQHLNFLKKAGLVQEKRFGRIKIFRYRIENLKARSLKRLFEIWQ
ncbi:MAG: winged helix-turn-helix domain-containing protein [Candidatus Heimdallarchaeota archaeon]